MGKHGVATSHSTQINSVTQFNVELDETDEYRDDIRRWRTCDLKDDRPPPLVIEVFLSTKNLNANQSLAILDDEGKRWDVKDALASFDSARSGKKRTSSEDEVILERWTVQLGENGAAFPSDLTNILPLVYKKSIVLFRSLFTYSKFLPAWKFSRRMAKGRSNGQLRLQYRVVGGTELGNLARSDNLSIPLCEGNELVVSDYAFGVTDSPAGPFSVHVTYRTNCEFRVDTSEALLSSRFLGTDEGFFQPLVPRAERLESARIPWNQEVGSLPSDRKVSMDQPDPSQAYGSLSTFHHVGPAAGPSPITALRNAQNLGPTSAASSPPARALPIQRSTQSSRSSLPAVEVTTGPGRRTSLSFQPFNTTSLSQSPATAVSSSPRPSSVRAPVLGVSKERVPNPGEPSSLWKKTAPLNPETATASSTSSSPKPVPYSRYSSSFSHRRARLSSGGTTKTDEDQNSSGKGSATSSAAQPGSGLIAEAGGGSSDSVHEDDESISDFLKMLDMKKDLLTPTDSAAAEASTRRTSAALMRFHRMRDSNAALSDSMSSSLLLHRSSSSSSRQLSSVPPMVPATSVSTSSSPGKPISPHTPHTPAIPSRLSANSIIDYSHRESGDRRLHPFLEEHESPSEEAPSEDTVEPVSSNVNAIDIPTSPRPFPPSYRRSSSVAQRRALPEDDDIAELYGMRSASMGAEDRQGRNRSAITEQIGLNDIQPDVARGQSSISNPQFDHQESAATRSSLKHRILTSTIPGLEGAGSGSASGSSLHQDYRSRPSRGGAGRGSIKPDGSTSSFGGGTGASGGRDHDGGSSSLLLERHVARPSFSRPEDKFDEDEPFLFAMSDLGASRRSLEEARGASSHAADAAPTARRGNRRD